MQSIILAALFALTVAVFAVAAEPLPPDKTVPDAKKDAVILEGGYTIVSGEMNGKAVPEDEIRGSLVQFTGNKILGTDKDKKEFFSCTYTLDTSKKPWVISMKSTSPKEEKSMGLIKQEGDTVTIVYALPGGEDPKEFRTKEKQHLFVMKSTNKFVKD